jgi:hypothetical protein
MSEPAADADLAASHVIAWAKGAAGALASDTLTPTERARLGDLLLGAAQWLEERATKAAKAEREAKAAAFRESIAHLPFAERMARIRQGH